MSATTPIDDWSPGWPSFAQFFRESSLAHSDSSFLVELHQDRDQRREWTRAQWYEWVRATSIGLAARGLRPGDCVAALIGNDAEALALAFACWSNGWTYVPLNPLESDARLAVVLEHAGARLLVHNESGAPRAASIGAAVTVPTCIATDLPRKAPRTPAVVRGGWDNAALRVYTSGTTGDPKGVELTLRNLLTDCDALQNVTRWDHRTRALVVLPIHHVNGLVVSCLQAWYAGASVVLCDRFRSDTFWKDAVIEGATVCSLVPTLLEFLLEDGDGPVGALDEIFCGAGPLMMQTVMAFEERFGVPVRHLYGMSETTAVATMIPQLPKRQRMAWYQQQGVPSVGPALPHVVVAVLDDAGAPCPADVRGEIAIRGASVMSRYAGDESATSEAFRGGWLHSGDEGFWIPSDNDTPFFFITGRMKEIIIRGGANISPLVIDEVLNSHPGIRFGVAVPFENRFYGEEVAAYVVAREPITEDEVLAHCAELLDFAFQPKVVVFGEDVPFTSTGKPKRLSLKKHLAAELARYRDVQFRRNRKPPGLIAD